MNKMYEVRASYDKDSIWIYQAYSNNIAIPAIAAQRFVPPFSMNRMTWIKPSFLWLMHRSNWGQKNGQEKILGVRITRKGWEEALRSAVLTSFYQEVYVDYNSWNDEFKNAKVHIQWDPERSIHGKPLNYYSIQIGLSRFIIEKFVDEWILEIRDITPTVKKIYKLLGDGSASKAKKLLPLERLYPVLDEIGKKILL